MSLYEKVPASVNFVEREKQTEKFWHDNDIFRKSMEQRKGDKTYTFYDGPPTANGKPHIGHVLTRVIKDMLPRYRTMTGYGIHMVFRLSLKLRRCSVLTVRIRLKSTDLTRS